MAKQTFSVGQVLTAAQMTSLQQTAMGGGSATAKTASYTLVAADAGTVVSVNSTSATTITVNTGLFAAGDTVTIQNLNTGVSTITAGTATVNSSASLALAQYEGGQLYFVSASAAIFFKGAGTATASGGMTLISTTTLTGASVSLSSIPATYKNLQLVIRAYRPSTGDVHCRFRFNGDSASNRHFSLLALEVTNTAFNDTSAQLTYNTDNTTSTGLTIANIYDYANTSTWKFFNSSSLVVGNGNPAIQNISTRWGTYNQTGAISSIDLFPNSGNFAAGTALLYGVS